MFSALTPAELKIVIDAMDERKVHKGDFLI